MSWLILASLPSASRIAYLLYLSIDLVLFFVNGVDPAPGPIKNSGGAKKLDPLNLFKIYNNYTNPRKRMATQNEIGELAMFLTSDKADYINGQIIRIDGGEVVKNSGEFNFLTNIPFYKP